MKDHDPLHEQITIQPEKHSKQQAKIRGYLIQHPFRPATACILAALNSSLRIPTSW
jgi:hypothetical protein